MEAIYSKTAEMRNCHFICLEPAIQNSKLITVSWRSTLVVSAPSEETANEQKKVKKVASAFSTNAALYDAIIENRLMTTQVMVAPSFFRARRDENFWSLWR